MTRRVLVVDVGGTDLKVFLPGSDTPAVTPSGPRFTPRAVVAVVTRMIAGRPYDVVSIGVPAVMMKGRIVAEPPNLGPGWTRFDFPKAFGKPVRLVNDAAMQALGSYEGGTMLFLGLGTGLGTALVVGGKVVPLELGLLPYRRGTCEDYLGTCGFMRLPRWKWREHVAAVATRLKEAMVADYVVLGGGRASALGELPAGCRRGDNRNALEGGRRLWD
jgi:polyphosphate glucokinase